VVDKTGTLTEGRPTVTAVVPLGRSAPRPTCCGSRRPSERASEHPLAAAIVRAAEERGIAPGAAGRLPLVTGKGVVGTVDGRRGRARQPGADGGARGRRRRGGRRADELRREGATVMHVAPAGTLSGLVAVADPVKASTRRRSRPCGGRACASSCSPGDNRTTAEAVARRLGIAEVEAEVLPEGRPPSCSACAPPATSWRWRRRRERRPGAGRGRRRHRHGHRCRRRDRERRASRWSRATSPRSPGRGGSRALTMRNIRQNLFFAFAYNALGVPVAAGLLYPGARAHPAQG
jgi:Cu+-exporting ATPase